jgi:integrase
MKKYPNCRLRRIGGHSYWVARLVFPPDPFTGIRPRTKEFSAKTAAEAHAAREKARETFDRNPRADRNTTFAAFLKNEFLPFEESRYKDGALSWGRYQERRSRIQRFVLQHEAGKKLCRYTLASLTPELLEQFFDALLRANVGPNRRNMVRQDLLLAIRKAKRRLQFPVSEYFLDIPAASEIRKRKALFAADDIIDRIYDESFSVESRATVAFEFIINCRPNEMWPLLWDDIDWQTNEVTINKALQRDEHGYTVKDCTKTGRRGDRRLPLGTLLSDLLRRILKARMADGVASEYVFCQADGTRHDKDSFAYAWDRIRRELNLPSGPTFYSLKTVGNTYALANGIPSSVQAQKMGHTTTRMADNDYRMVMDSEVIKAVEIYGKPRPKQIVKGKRKG